ncbi:glycosyltransferase family 4 protein [Azospirillum picis]|uniref:Glycosyltransferase involved in cell wall biosynthesis n=1 Tax=Azospirillum picis TaxID=488438 RepID=A0ABU0MGS5_9PROT|nr:glycosyltransferase family 4 protein [Azospirillum picis]MBP2299111.1 glycosyltransferase involved in cell wall biosynthesis [Azospirillum picis]MDQ0532647.1 glycosyltransferase involved in cell wall biosynthesis [Azospirillum picis]
MDSTNDSRFQSRQGGASRRRVIVFATPGALDGGGGIGRMTGYVVDQFDKSGAPDSIILDTRGTGSVLLSPFYLGRTLARLGVLLARRRVSVVHINVSERASFLRKAAVQAVAGLMSCPTVVHLHGASFVDYFEGGRFARGISRWLFDRCGRVVVLGDNWRDYLVQSVRTDPHKIRVLYNAVPDVGTDLGPRRPPEPGASLALLVLANLSERKGIGTLLHACADLKRRGQPFHVTIGGGGDVDGYRRMAAELGVAEECRFLGWIGREEAHAHIRSHDMLLLPSTHEGLPMVILEALSAQLPVVTTAVGSIPEVLTDGETARIIPVNDAAALADAVVQLGSDPELYGRLAGNGRRLFLKQFGIDAYAKSLLAIYRELERPGGELGGQLAESAASAASKRR